MPNIIIAIGNPICDCGTEMDIDNKTLTLTCPASNCKKKFKIICKEITGEKS